VAIEANRPECCDSAAYDRGKCCGNPNLLVTAYDVAQAIRAFVAIEANRALKEVSDAN
jgi:hypothetical protein